MREVRIAMSSAAGFLQAILREPDDDTPRLVYADWLDETGKPEDAARAELIRVQIELPRCQRWSPGHEELSDRAEALIKAHGDTWLGPLLPLVRASVPVGVAGYEFSRGMPHVKLSPGKLLQKAHSRLAEEWLPKLGVQEVEFLGVTMRVAEVAGLPALRHLHSLAWSYSHLDDDGLRDLSRSPHLGNLVTLALDRAWATDAGLGRIARAASLGKLTTLRLTGSYGKSRVTAAGIRAVLGGDLPRLDSLDLEGGAWGMTRIGDLATLTGFRRLKRLGLSYNFIKGRDVRLLAENPDVANLVELDLSSNEIDDDGACALAESPHLAGLKRLDLSGSPGRGQQIFSPETQQRLRDRFGDALVI
jgi:uncharacterized protein (TIGR02996 family)